MAKLTQLNLKGDAGQNSSAPDQPLRLGNKGKIAALAGSGVVGLLLSIFLLQTSGCSREKEKPVLVNPSTQISSSQPTQAVAALTPPAPDTKAVPKKHARKKSSTVTYTNPAYGVSFRYPRTYALKTGEEPHLDLSGLGPVETGFVQPGGVTVAAVEMPRNSYPGSEFSSAFFSVSVNPSLTAEECAQFSFATPDSPDGPLTTANKVKVGAIEFDQLEDAMKLFDTKYYHVFENGACYEFSLGLGITDDAAEAGVANINFDNVFDRLERILATVKIEPGVAPEVATQAPVHTEEKANQ
jgi:hypothetical protein